MAQQVPLPLSIYTVGDTATVTYTFTLPGTPLLSYPPDAVPPTLIDPGGFTVRVQPPAQKPGYGPPTAPYTLTYGVDAALARVSTGVYQATIPIGLNDIGRWHVRIHATPNGLNQGAGVVEWEFDSKASALAAPN